ncbi:hypothetical protein [Mucilaginibacter gotjawali]|uniref:Uncharacterized protein n=1 Tax=Mucilaginibacter gotjawali TaxID=1550579 RepID=A0A839SCT0_9SPHI|nr:hypothetical protein [Mucilaginibacter gotjawali]MBB3056015.1 hypothetical protein [Mucilaginibacter gotjawali]
MKTLSFITFQFYKILLLFNIACTLLAIAVVWYGFGHIDAFILFIAKIFGFAGAVMLHQYSAKETYYYFRNAGYRMRSVVLMALLADALLYSLSVFLFNLITYAAGHFKS